MTATTSDTIVTVEEQMRGWLAHIHRFKEFHKQVPGYQRLSEMMDFFSRWRVLPFDDRAADECRRLRGLRLRLGTMDFKIAAIALTHNALVLSANLQDFRKVPGLRVENSLD